MSQIICVGSCSKDIFFPTKEGVIINTPEDVKSQKKIAFELGAKYQIDDRHEAVGGVAANVAQGLARLGIETSIFSYVGDDLIGQWILGELKKAKVGTERIKIVPNCKSDLSAIIVDENSGDRTIFFNRDANERMDVADSDIDGNSWILLSALNGKWEENLDNILKFAEVNKISIALNPGQRNIKDNVQKVIEAVKKTKVLILNKDEAIEIISAAETDENINDEINLIKKLKALGPDIVALTDGKNGSWIFDGRELLRADAPVVKPLETTGAGDAFTSASLAAIIQGLSLKEVMQWGAANSGNVVLYFGASRGLLTEMEIKQKSKNISISPVQE
jgi:sugar/nucleoside kinase (ribokinase family)